MKKPNARLHLFLILLYFMCMLPTVEYFKVHPNLFSFTLMVLVVGTFYLLMYHFYRRHKDYAAKKYPRVEEHKSWTQLPS